ncbi:hypothetical protein AA313_de0205192 [Arthrobotrys entomopaga]|nr:hypothetical protein AA313_de0205192 [Arthrobotrys entomopaga]
MPIRPTDATKQRNAIKNRDSDPTRLRKHQGKNSNQDSDSNGTSNGGDDNGNYSQHEVDDGDGDGDDDENNFDVECILAEKKDLGSGRTLYLVNWKGFEEKDYTWEPREHFHAPDTISDWEAYKRKTAEPERYDWRAWDKIYGEVYGDEDFIQNSERGLLESHIFPSLGDQRHPTHALVEPLDSVKNTEGEGERPKIFDHQSAAVRDNIQVSSYDHIE